MKKKQITEIIEYVGGKENIKKVWHCMTRLRFDLHENDKVEEKQLKTISGIIGTNFQSNQFQIIIGTNVGEYYTVIHELLYNTSFNNEIDENMPKKKDLVKSLLDVVSGVFGPIVPAIAGAGMIKGLLSGLLALKLLEKTSETVIVVDLIASGVFYFLPFFLAVSASKIFKVNEYLGIAIAGGFMYPTLIDAAKAGKILSFSFLGLPLPVFNYAGSVIPIIISIWTLGYIHKHVNKIVPNILRVVFTPTITLFIAIPFSLIVIGPIGIYFGKGLAYIIKNLFDISPILAGIVVGAIRPISIFTGMHHAMTPIALQNFTENGHDMLMPMMFMANLAITGSAFAIYFKKRNPNDKSIVFSSAVSGLLGITEPALFGVLTQYKKAFISATIASSIASAFIASFGVRLYGYVTSSIFSLPAYIGPYF
ncbi:PTS transporter subunit EIIC, partial [Cetobacterium sp.]|uniref:PTS transporter subunit EIIC n=1 Tax=Cetobacterium sp. TaxID=2071632 RepID=UPI003EE6EDB2